MTRTLRVAMTQPYVPRYRVALFDRVHASLATAGVELRVFYPPPTTARQARGDLTNPPWAQEVPARTARTSAGTIYRSALPKQWRDADLLVTELAAGNLNAWARALRRRPFVLWGHGMSYTSAPSRSRDLLEVPLLRASSHVLTYLPSGTAAVRRRARLPARRATPFRNSTDTRALQAARAVVTPQRQAAVRAELGLAGPADIALYVGALDPTKNIPLLLDTADVAAHRSPSFHLIVAGQGPEEEAVRRRARDSAHIHWVGYADLVRLAELGSIARAMLAPGRVGLVAVDALALRLPVITSRAARHAPEIEYLREGQDVFYAEAGAAAVADLLLEVMAGAPRASSIPPSIDESADVISTVILAELGRSDGRR
jgi:glycosyltransferase involved in cell wall biosynthesis